MISLLGATIIMRLLNRVVNLRNANTSALSLCIPYTYLQCTCCKIRLPVPTKGIANSPRPNQNILSSIINPKKSVLGSEMATPNAIGEKKLRCRSHNQSSAKPINLNDALLNSEFDFC